MKKKVLIALAVLAVLVVVAVGAVFALKGSEEIANTYADEAKKVIVQSEAICKDIKTIEQKYTKWGYIPDDKVSEYLNDVGAYAEQQKELGTVNSYTIGEYAASITSSEGFTTMIIPPKRQKLASGNFVQIATFEPYASSWEYKQQNFQAGLLKWINKATDVYGIDVFRDMKGLSVSKNVDSIIKNLGNNFKYAKKVYNKSVTFDELKNLNKYDLIIWQGHGGYLEDIHSGLVLSAKFMEYIDPNPQDWVDDYREKRILQTQDGECIVTSKFFDKYLKPRNTDAVIYLGACLSGKDNVLANSFLSKGFSAVFCYSTEVDISVEILLRTGLFTLLTSKLSDGKYYTLQEAYNKLASDGLTFFPKKGKQNLRLIDLSQQKIPTTTRTTPEENHNLLEQAKKAVNQVPAMTTRAPRQTTIKPTANTKAIPAGYTPIYTAQDLANVNKNLSGKYILMNDIDLSSWDNWKPLGSRNNLFSGVFDGNYYAIKNMKIVSGEDCWAGLFSAIEGAEIKNTGLIGTKINYKPNDPDSQAIVGGISGGAFNSTIMNCYNTGNISASSRIQKDIFDGDGTFAGGIVGWNYETTIANCYNTGSINALVSGIYGSRSGGIVASDNESVIRNCYNTGTVSATSLKSFSIAGGIIGNCTSVTTIQSCYNTGTVNTTPSDQIGSIVGGIGYSADGGYCYYLAKNSAKGVGEDHPRNYIKCFPLSDSQMKQQTSYTGFDFTNVWAISPSINNGYPYLRSMQP